MRTHAGREVYRRFEREEFLFVAALAHCPPWIAPCAKWRRAPASTPERAASAPWASCCGAGARARLARDRSAARNARDDVAHCHSFETRTASGDGGHHGAAATCPVVCELRPLRNLDQLAMSWIQRSPLQRHQVLCAAARPAPPIDALDHSTACCPAASHRAFGLKYETRRMARSTAMASGQRHGLATVIGGPSTVAPHSHEHLRAASTSWQRPPRRAPRLGHVRASRLAAIGG